MDSLDNITQENDTFRQNICAIDVKESSEILKLSQDIRKDICDAIRMFDTELFEQNQHPEHDFGIVNVQDLRINWRIAQFTNKNVPHAKQPKVIVSTVTEIIAELNDTLRTLGTGGRMFITNGIKILGEQALTDILKVMMHFEDFNEDNDPYNERDFGSLDVCGERVFWKIDYYDKSLKYGSQEPADSSITERILTLMLASEY
jgi:hypothetical protein